MKGTLKGCTVNDSLSDKAIIRYADFLKICISEHDDLANFGGFRLERDGLYVTPPDGAQLLSVEDLAVLSWHPTGNYDQPALALPCTLGQLRAFVVEAGLRGCIDEDELNEIVAEQAARLIAGSAATDTVPDTQAAPAVAESAPDHLDLLSANGAKRAAATRPKFSVTKASMIKQHKHEWPTIERDIADASKNELAAAKMGARGWAQPDALSWARANNKLVSVAKPADSLAQAMHNMRSLPGQTHKLEG